MPTRGDPHRTRYFQDMLQLVDSIYAAACGEKPWVQTFAEMCQVGKLDGCALSMVQTRERRRVVAVAYELGSTAEPTAIRGPMPGDRKLTDRVLGSAPGAVWQERQIVSDALPTTRSFWTDRTQPDGLVSWAWAVVGRDEGQVDCLEVYAGAGRASSGPELEDFLRQLAPHLTRAWRLGGGGRLRPAFSPSFSPAAAPAPDLAALPGAVQLRADFGLTRAESRLALRLAEGSSLASAAQDFGVKLTTIRSQLQQVFAKTGTSRQTELVAMLLSRGHGARGPLSNRAYSERHAAAPAEPGS